MIPTPTENSWDISSCILNRSTDLGLDVLCLSASSLNFPFLIADLVADIALIHESHCAAIEASSPVDGSNSLGPDSVNKMPSEEAVRDLPRSNMSTPIHDRSAQLSGPEIPGVQIREPGKVVLTVKIALSSIPLLTANWGESVIAIIDGWLFPSNSDSSW